MLHSWQETWPCLAWNSGGWEGASASRMALKDSTVALEILLTRMKLWWSRNYLPATAYIHTVP